MYTYEQFKTLAAKNLGGYFEETPYKAVSVDLTTVTKNNGQKEDRISVRTKDENGMSTFAPSMPVARLYADYQANGGDFADTMRAFASEYVHAIQVAPSAVQDVDEIFSVKFIMDNCFCRLVNTSANQEQLSNCPHKEMLDLSVMYRVKVGDSEDGLASYVVNNEILERTGITPELLEEQAMKNTKEMFPPTIRSMRDVLSKALGFDDEVNLPISTPDNLFVMSNQSCTYGATSLIYTDKLQEFAEQFDSNLIVLPSSTHEVLLVLGDKADIDAYVSGMVADVNSAIVSPQDQLSNQVYFYDKDAKSLTVATSQPELVESLQPEVKNRGMNI